MRIYFNNDLSACDSPDKSDGVETRVYFNNQATLALRLDDCIDGHPEFSDNSFNWKLIPQVCDPEAYADPNSEEDNTTPICGWVEGNHNWYGEPYTMLAGFKYKTSLYFMWPEL